MRVSFGTDVKGLSNDSALLPPQKKQIGGDINEPSYIEDQNTVDLHAIPANGDFVFPSTKGTQRTNIVKHGIVVRIWNTSQCSRGYIKGPCASNSESNFAIIAIAKYPSNKAKSEYNCKS